MSPLHNVLLGIKTSQDSILIQYQFFLMVFLTTWTPGSIAYLKLDFYNYIDFEYLQQTSGVVYIRLKWSANPRKQCVLLPPRMGKLGAHLYRFISQSSVWKHYLQLWRREEILQLWRREDIYFEGGGLRRKNKRTESSFSRLQAFSHCFFIGLERGSIPLASPTPSSAYDPDCMTLSIFLHAKLNKSIERSCIQRLLLFFTLPSSKKFAFWRFLNLEKIRCIPWL